MSNPSVSVRRPRSRGVTVALWVARAVALLPVLYFLFMAMVAVACFSDSCADRNMIYAVPAVVAAVLLGWTPYAVVRILQRDGVTPTTARVAAVLLGHAVLVWGAFTIVVVYLIRTTGV
ncbi:hypothetical protein [Actinoplanes philippinensis]|nr:hypothetical protein [Actinoplanes philippinensis]